MKKALVFYNPKAGIVSKNKKRQKLVDALDQAGIQSQTVLVQDYCKKNYPSNAQCDVVIAAGGDGTICLAANYIMKHCPGTPLGIIPMGSGNLFAETMSIPVNFERAIKTIAAAKTKKIDLGLVDGREYFVLSFSIGHMAEVICRTPQCDKQRYGFFAYLKAFIIRRIKIRQFEFEVDGKPFKIFGNNLFIFNGIRFFGFTPAKKSDCQDGELDLFITSNRSFIGWWQAFLYMVLFKKPPHLVSTTSGKEFIIHSTETGDLRAQIDGDRLELGRSAKITIVPSVLDVITP
ncbi:MAG: diacylglycerol kinase family lipid kinase [Patescibacteria group bacterium]|nr:diacylglycerol kinase family lipid kinase [Patescibacteria group bacterium]